MSKTRLCPREIVPWRKMSTSLTLSAWFTCCKTPVADLESHVVCMTWSPDACPTGCTVQYFTALQRKHESISSTYQADVQTESIGHDGCHWRRMHHGASSQRNTRCIRWPHGVVAVQGSAGRMYRAVPRAARPQHL